jgi:HAD superfamily hydrolase (TIGR01509 family)
MSSIKALIFDFDGLLVNTEELRLISFQEFLKRRRKKFNDKDYPQTMLTGPAISTTVILKEKYNLDGKLEDLDQERRAIFQKLFETRLTFLDGVYELLERVKNWPVKCAIASTRNREQIEDGLTRLGVLGRFSVIVTNQDLRGGKGKPDPEIYLIAAKKLGVDPKNCLVLEDAPHGIEAAKAAGMRAIYVPDSKFVDSYHEKADLILKNMHELTDEVLGKLIHG